MGPLPFDRSRLADNFGARISFSDALSVEFEAFLRFKVGDIKMEYDYRLIIDSHIPSIFPNSRPASQSSVEA